MDLFHTTAKSLLPFTHWRIVEPMLFQPVIVRLLRGIGRMVYVTGQNNNFILCWWFLFQVCLEAVQAARKVYYTMIKSGKQVVRENMTIFAGMANRSLDPMHKQVPVHVLEAWMKRFELFQSMYWSKWHCRSWSHHAQQCLRHIFRVCGCHFIESDVVEEGRLTAEHVDTEFQIVWVFAVIAALCDNSAADPEGLTLNAFNMQSDHHLIIFSNTVPLWPSTGLHSVDHKFKRLLEKSDHNFTSRDAAFMACSFFVRFFWLRILVYSASHFLRCLVLSCS